MARIKPLQATEVIGAQTDATAQVARSKLLGTAQVDCTGPLPPTEVDCTGPLLSLIHI